MNLSKEYTLVFFRKEGGRNAGKQEHHAHNDQDIGQQVRCFVAQNAAYAFFVAAYAAVKGTVEPAEESTLVLTVITLGDRFEHRGTQSRGEHQGDHNRQGHGRYDGDRELTVDHTGGTAEERHRQQYRRQYKGNTHQSALDLAHGLLGGFFGRQAFLGHYPLDVFHHNDGIVHQQADGQDHTEHGQGVNAEACSGEDPEGTQQYNRYCHRGDDGGAEVLQEQEHHQEHQHDSFYQCFNNPFDGGRDHWSGVIREYDFHPWREEGFQVSNGFANGFGCVQGVSVRRQLDCNTGRWLAVVLGADAVVLTAQAHFGDITQTNLRAVGVHFQQDLFKLVCGLQAGFANDRCVQLLAFQRRQTTQLTGRHLYVLRRDRGFNIHRRQVVLVQLGRVQPDTHGVLSTEHLEVTHTCRPRQRVLHVGDDVVRQVVLVHAAVGGHHADYHQEVFHCLGHPDTLLLHFLRQQRGGQVQLVLHLDLSGVRVGTLVERYGNGHAAVGVTFR